MKQILTFSNAIDGKKAKESPKGLRIYSGDACVMCEYSVMFNVRLLKFLFGFPVLNRTDSITKN